MNTKNVFIAAILVLGNATLLTGGRSGSGYGQTSVTAGIISEAAEVLGTQIPTSAQDSFFQMFGV